MDILDDTPNGAFSTLSAGISDTDLSMSITDASLFPVPTTGYIARIFSSAYDSPVEDDDREAVRITAKPSDYTIERAKEGTTAKTWPAGSKIAVCPSEKMFEDIDGTLANCLGGRQSGSATIDASGSITYSYPFMVVRNYGDAADTLATITGGTEGDFLLIRPYSSSHGDLTLDDSGNIVPGADDVIVRSPTDAVLLQYQSSYWRVIAVWYYYQPWYRVEYGQDGSIYSSRHISIVNPAESKGSYDPTQLAITTDEIPITTDRWDSDGYLIDVRRDGTSQGGLQVASGTVSIDGFSGMHTSQFEIEPGSLPPRGGVVINTGKRIPAELEYYELERVETFWNELTGERETRKRIQRIYPSTVTEVDPKWRHVVKDITGIETHKQSQYLSSTTTKKDARVFGVYEMRRMESAEQRGASRNDRALHSVMATGTGVIRVTDTNGDVMPGDYLCSSVREWEAEKQTELQLCNFTIAKALEAVVWADEPEDPRLGYKWKLVPATIHCG